MEQKEAYKSRLSTRTNSLGGRPRSIPRRYTIIPASKAGGKLAGKKTPITGGDNSRGWVVAFAKQICDWN